MATADCLTARLAKEGQLPVFYALAWLQYGGRNSLVPTLVIFFVVFKVLAGKVKKTMDLTPFSMM